MIINKEIRHTVLVVDDSDIIRHSLKKFFEDYNLEVITCNDGLEGVQYALQYKPVVIFLDLLMPNLNGVKMLQVIKVMDDLKHIPVIVISGNTNKRNVLAAIEAGAERVISKPLKKELIIKNVKEVLGDDFLSKAKKNVQFSNDDNLELVNQLQEFFLNSFPEKEKAIINSLQNHNIELLKIISHEIKGTGTSIGYPELTHVGSDIYGRLLQPHINWPYIQDKFDQLIEIVNEIKNTNVKVSI